MQTSVPARSSPTYRTPRSAIAFAVLLVGLAVLFLGVAFVYGHGWADVVSGVLGVGLVAAWVVAFAAFIWWWTRPSARA